MLIGRDRILSKSLQHIRKTKPGLYVIGSKGIGKSAILQWLFEHHGKGAFISCRTPKKEILKEIVASIGVETEKSLDRLQVPELEKIVLQARAGILFIDNAEELKPALRSFLEPMRDRKWVFVLACSNVKAGYEKLYWGLKRVELDPLKWDDSLRIAKNIIQKEGLKADPMVVARLSRGYPARIVLLARGEAVPLSADERRKEDEINIAPVLLICVSLGVAVRVVGLGTGMQDLYILGGLATAFGLLARFVMVEARRDGKRI